MAKYIPASVLETLIEQMEGIYQHDLENYRRTGSAWRDGKCDGLDISMQLIQDVLHEHAVNGRLKWGD